MFKKIALAALVAAALVVIGMEIDQWCSFEEVRLQGVYKVTSIEHSPEGNVLREIRIDLESSHRNDIGWYAGDLMKSFSLRGDPRDVQLGSRLVCSKEMKVHLLSREPVPGTARYRCSTDIEGPGNRRVLSFWRTEKAVLP